jgi:manganese-dependent ADP-ribose/CDP-alcohol diphosphatase
MKSVLLLMSIGFAGCAPQPVPEPEPIQEKPLFQFGLLADVQYADKDTVGRRAYRDALPLLVECADDLADRDLAFIVQLGDIIDGRATLTESMIDLEKSLRPLEETGHPLLHVIGNHCLSVPRAQLQQRLGLKESWYSQAQNGWRFVVLDSMALSIHGDSQQAGREWLKAHPRKDHPQAYDWNGGFGAEQLAWLAAELATAAEQEERVAVFAHHPIHADASSPAHLAWDHAEALKLISASPASVAYFSGHDHAGGYTTHGDVHHWTLPAMLEARAPSNAYAIVEVWPEHLIVRGEGDVTTRLLSR